MKKIINSLSLQAILMLLVPIFGFVVFSLLFYPLAPHCSVGKGINGCTPICIKIGDNIESTPCFYESPAAEQLFIFQNSLLFYSVIIFLIGILVFKFRQRLKQALLIIAFYPFYLNMWNKKNKNIISKTVVAIAVFLLFLEWVLGYVVFISLLFGLRNIFG